MIKYYYVTKEKINKHNLNWSRIPDYPYRILRGSGSGKTSALLHLIKQQDDDD